MADVLSEILTLSRNNTFVLPESFTDEQNLALHRKWVLKPNKKEKPQTWENKLMHGTRKGLGNITTGWPVLPFRKLLDKHETSIFLEGPVIQAVDPENPLPTEFSSALDDLKEPCKCDLLKYFKLFDAYDLRDFGLVDKTPGLEFKHKYSRKDHIYVACYLSILAILKCLKDTLGWKYAHKNRDNPAEAEMIRSKVLVLYRGLLSVDTLSHLTPEVKDYYNLLLSWCEKILKAKTFGGECIDAINAVFNVANEIPFGQIKWPKNPPITAFSCLEELGQVIDPIYQKNNCTMPMCGGGKGKWGGCGLLDKLRRDDGKAVINFYHAESKTYLCGKCVEAYPY